jgi:hypothetical protein
MTCQKIAEIQVMQLLVTTVTADTHLHIRSPTCLDCRCANATLKICNGLPRQSGYRDQLELQVHCYLAGSVVAVENG